MLPDALARPQTGSLALCRPLICEIVLISRPGGYEDVAVWVLGVDIPDAHERPVPNRRGALLLFRHKVSFSQRASRYASRRSSRCLTLDLDPSSSPGT